VELRCPLHSLFDSTCSCSSIAGPRQLHSLIPCPAFRRLQCVELRYVVSTAQRSVPHVAALALQALKASHTCLLIFKVTVENVTPSRGKVKWSAEKPHVGNPHTGNHYNILKHNHHVCMYAQILMLMCLATNCSPPCLPPPSFLSLPTPPPSPSPPSLHSCPLYTHTCKIIHNKHNYLVYQRWSNTITLQFICM